MIGIDQIQLSLMLLDSRRLNNPYGMHRIMSTFCVERWRRSSAEYAGYVPPTLTTFYAKPAPMATQNYFEFNGKKQTNLTQEYLN